MVHRIQDRRLLNQVLKTEKEYATALGTLLTSSQSSLAALSGYAAGCPPAQAGIVIHVVNALSGAEDALRKYALAVDTWREDLLLLKKKEEEVANILRDRDILVGRLLKVSSKRSNRDSVIQSPQQSMLTLHSASEGVFGNSNLLSLSLPGANHSNHSTTKLKEAQIELQACEAELAQQEQALDQIRSQVIRGGLARRSKALVECGWMWGERGKDALRSLEVTHRDETESSPARGPLAAGHYPHIRHSHDHDSQLSSLTPSQSASQIFLPGSPSESTTTPPTHPSLATTLASFSAGASLGTSKPLPEPQRTPSFSLAIPPAHSINDEHEVDFQPKMVAEPEEEKRAESSDEDVAKLTVRENNPFGLRVASTSAPRDAGRPTSLIKKEHLAPKRSSTLGVFHTSPPREQSKRKGSSDLGARVGYPMHDPNYGQPYSRKRSTSFSLFSGIAGLFKGQSSKRSIDEQGYTGPKAGDAWSSRTDRKLAKARRPGGGEYSSSEDDLPSTAHRKSKMIEVQNNPYGFGSDVSSSRLQKRQALVDGHTERPPIERPSPMRRSNSSRSSARTQITAANTALNSVSPSQQTSELPSEVTKQSGVTRKPSRTHAYPPPEAPSLLGVVEASRHQPRSASTSTVPDLPPARFEIVRAPPSIIQAPLLMVGTTPSPLVASKQPYSPTNHKRTNSLHSSPNLKGVSTPPPGSSPLTAMSFPRISTPPVGPLKSALRNPSISPSRSPPPTEAAIKGSLPPPPRSTGSSSTEGTPKLNGHATLPSVPYPTSRPMPSSSRILSPEPRRLSDIPASNRSSMYSEDSVYETGQEDFDEEDSDKATPPASPRAVPTFLVQTPSQPLFRGPTPPAKGSPPAPTIRLVPTANGDVDAHDATSSQGSKATRRKSVRMIIHPTVTVTAPSMYDPPSSPEAPKTRAREPEWEAENVELRSAPSAWESRVNTQKNMWEPSSDEDEEYGAAKRALNRVSARLEDLGRPKRHR